MKSTVKSILNRFHIRTLRAFITLMITFIVALSLLIAGSYFYIRTAGLLTENLKDNITRQLEQVNQGIEDNISLIDTLYPLIMSNPSIRDNLDITPGQKSPSAYSKRLIIEKQLRYLLISNYLWNQKFLNAAYIVDADNQFYSVGLHQEQTKNPKELLSMISKLPENFTAMEIQSLPDDPHSIYFSRNIFSSYTGKKIATIIIDINQDVFENSYSQNIGQNSNVYLFHHNQTIIGKVRDPYLEETLIPHLASQKMQESFEEINLNHEKYFMASRQIGQMELTSVVLAPKKELFAALHQTNNTFLIVFLIILLSTIFFAVCVSHLISRPIRRMSQCVKEIANGNRSKELPTSLYDEFNDFAMTFRQMLHKLDSYYNELYQKQLLLKNAQIKSLQSQMNPHFLFNVLDTVAWKAAMTENEDIYQMIVSLGELLRSNILANEREFIPLEDELKNVKFYIYLQQMRFEDKFDVTFSVESSVLHYLVPQFSVQPLVENAIVHGLEPKKDSGKLCINIIHNPNSLEISVIDNGVGFSKDMKLDNIRSSSEDSHTHIGLNNLNKRLTMLFDESAGLHIDSSPNCYTAVSFQIPKMTEVP